MLASNPARILEQISRRARIPLTQESTSGDHALKARPGAVWMVRVVSIGPRGCWGQDQGLRMKSVRWISLLAMVCSC
jgi:hypothetical protein